MDLSEYVKLHALTEATISLGSGLLQQILSEIVIEEIPLGRTPETWIRVRISLKDVLHVRLDI